MLRQPFFLFEQFHIADDRGQRGLNIMGDIGYQFYLHPFALHLFLHRLIHSIPNIIQVFHSLPQSGAFPHHFFFPQFPVMDGLYLLHQIVHIFCRFPAAYYK